MFPLRQVGERLPPVGQRAEVAVAVLVLHGLQLADDVVGALLEANVAGRRPHQADRGQIVPGDVSGEIAAVAIPAAVRLAPSAADRRAAR